MSKRQEAIKALRDMTDDELHEHVQEQRRRLFELRFQMATGQVTHAGSEGDAVGRDRQGAQQRQRLARRQVRVGDPEDVKTKSLSQLGRLDDLWGWNVRCETNAKLDAVHWGPLRPK